MLRTGTYYGNVFARTISGFRGLNQSVAPLYPLDDQRVIGMLNFDTSFFTLNRRDGTIPIEQLSGRMYGVLETESMRVVAHGSNLGIESK